MSTLRPPRLLIVDPQRIFAEPSSDWASPAWDGAWDRIRALAAQVGPERTLISRWLPTADRETSWGDYFRAWALRGRVRDGSALRAGRRRRRPHRAPDD